MPYTPGEQPKDRKFIKLNTNESPFPPSEKAKEGARKAAESLMLYSDPECTALHRAFAEVYGLKPSQVIATNGSDEILNFAFMAFCDEETPAAFADITYGFYKVFADLYGIEKKIIPLREDFSIVPSDYFRLGATIFIANPNAPTGIALTRDEIERILVENPNNVVVIDEAYVDFGAESCVPLIDKYDNLLVTVTFSKSRSMAGARLGFGMASEALIADLMALKYSTNPYNVNSMTAAAGIGVLSDEDYTRANCKKIAENRDFLLASLRALGFEATDSLSNFIFTKHASIAGEKLYAALREKGILVRHFASERISDYVRITIGTREQCEALLTAVREILLET